MIREVKIPKLNVSKSESVNEVVSKLAWMGSMIAIIAVIVFLIALIVSIFG